jgi:hypothetical protein
MMIPTVRSVAGNPVLEISERLMNAAFVAGCASCDRIHDMSSNICFLVVNEKSGAVGHGRKIRIAPGEATRLDDCHAVLGVSERGIEVLRRDGARRAFPINGAHECATFVFEN